MRYFKLTAGLTGLIVIAQFFTTVSLSAGQEKTRLRDDADRFSQITSTVLAPVYGPLAEYIVTEFELAEKKGTGIDIGGGPGQLVIELCKRTKGVHWINTDINTDFFPYTARTAEKAGLGNRISTLFADVHDLPFLDNYADVIVSRGSFQFWENKLKAFSEIYRVLKPGGIAYIGRGFSENLPVDTARNIRSRQKERGGMPEYDVNQTAIELDEIVKSLGIKDYRIHIPNPDGSEGVNYGIWLEFHKTGILKSEAAEHPEYLLEPIVIKGSQARDVLKKPMSESSGLELSTTVVKRQEIKKQGSKTIMDALEYVPGAWIESRGRKVKQFFSIRGQTYPYPEYAIDGALYREFHEIPYFFSSADIERIEVLRSSAAMLSGISGLTGVVNIIPRTYTKPETSWEIEYGSFDSYRSHLSHGGKVNDISYSIGMDSPHTDGPSGRHAAEGMSNFQGTMNWEPSPSLSIRTSLFHIYGKRELAQALPPAAKRFRESFEQFDPFRTTFATIRTFYQPHETSSTDLLLYYADRDHTFISENESGHVSAREWDYEWGLNMVQSVSLSANNVLRAGGYYNRWTAPNGKRFYTGRKCDLETFSAAVVDEHNFGSLTVDAGLRWARTYIHEYGAFNINGSPKGFTNIEPVRDEWEPSDFSGSAGVSYYMSPYISFHTNIAAGFVRPRKGTLDVNGREPANEQRLKLDTGLRLLNDRLGEISFVGFMTRQNNAIVLSGKTDTINGRIMELYMNRDQYQTGLEIDTKSAPMYNTARLFLNLTAMSSQAEINGEKKRNRELPQYIAGGGIYSFFSNYDFNVFFKYVSSYESTRFTAAPAGEPLIPQPLGDYLTLNLTFGRAFGGTLRSRIYFEIKNLTDKRFSTVVGYPDYGRRYIIGLRQTI